MSGKHGHGKPGRETTGDVSGGVWVVMAAACFRRDGGHLLITPQGAMGGGQNEA